MVKRLIAAFLWFYATWALYGVLVWAIGSPKMAGPLVAAALSAFVAIDPLHVFWPVGRSRPKA